MIKIEEDFLACLVTDAYTLWEDNLEYFVLCAK